MELEPGRALDNEAKRGHNQMSFPAVVPVKDIQSQNISKTQSIEKIESYSMILN
jgi:hypothetical protein